MLGSNLREAWRTLINIEIFVNENKISLKNGKKIFMLKDLIVIKKVFGKSDV